MHIYIYIYLSIYLSIHLSLSLYLSIYLSLSLYIHIYTHTYSFHIRWANELRFQRLADYLLHQRVQLLLALALPGDDGGSRLVVYHLQAHILDAF